MKQETHCGLPVKKSKKLDAHWQYCGMSKKSKKPCQCGFIFGIAGEAYALKALSITDGVDPVFSTISRNRLIKRVTALLNMAHGIDTDDILIIDKSQIGNKGRESD